MTRNEEDDDVCNLEDDELSLVFAFDRNIRIKAFP